MKAAGLRGLKGLRSRVDLATEGVCHSSGGAIGCGSFRLRHSCTIEETHVKNGSVST